MDYETTLLALCKKNVMVLFLPALDVMGKWSLLDLFVLTAMISAFGIKIRNQETWPDVIILPDDFVKVRFFLLQHCFKQIKISEFARFHSKK